MMNLTVSSRIGRTCVLLLAILLAAVLVLPAAAAAQESGRVVRVGWHEPPYFITDEYGRRSGYSYEYQRKLAAYTGWTYEYVYGSWSELLQLHEKYLSSGGTDLYLTPGELDWLSAHGTIRVGCQDNYLAFCAQDPATGELTGAEGFPRLRRRRAPERAARLRGHRVSHRCRRHGGDEKRRGGLRVPGELHRL